MDPLLQLERIPSLAGIEPGTARYINKAIADAKHISQRALEVGVFTISYANWVNSVWYCFSLWLHNY